MDKSGQGTNSMVKISACMMVKNEEEMLPRCLNSIKDFVDEIIIVDTGSTDRSKEIALQFGAKIYDHPWEKREDGSDRHDFSKARNLSLGYASNEWCFIIDADEEFVMASNVTPELIKKWLFQMPSNGVAGVVRLVDIQQGKQCMEMPTARLYRKGSIHYIKNIHNQPQVDGDGHFCPFFILKHYGYDLSPDKMEAKFERSRRALLERFENDPTDYLALYYLTELFSNRGRAKEAVEFAEEYLKHKDECGGNFCTGIYYTACHCYLSMENPEKAEEWLKMGLDQNPDDLDLCFTLLELGVLTNNRDKIFIGGRKYLKLYSIYQATPGFNGGNFIYTTNPECYCYVVYQLTVNELIEGFTTMSLLEQGLSQTSPEYRSNLLLDLKRTLDPYGFKIEITETEPSQAPINMKPVGAPSEQTIKRIMEV